jgi:hypothetical protein
MNRLFALVALLLCLAASAGPQADRGPPADIVALRNVEFTFHTAGSVLREKNLDLMMSIYADDAELTDTAHDNKLYKGKEQVRSYWADVSGPFRPEHHWIGYTPAMRMHAEVNGNRATLSLRVPVDGHRQQRGRRAFLLRHDPRTGARALAGQGHQSRQGSD